MPYIVRIADMVYSLDFFLSFETFVKGIRCLGGFSLVDSLVAPSSELWCMFSAKGREGKGICEG